eukprot:TRINITY_DN21877_c0_g1_i2.p1 TRINITY_DN21877_c0_g1~~TRINITY_DN21877_c0_g1_i2.p1  ORF type:complete len:575 (+),score=169.98 TRINITY_DN21877_c0_g1_i2:227-1951(+)
MSDDDEYYSEDDDEIEYDEDEDGASVGDEFNETNLLQLEVQYLKMLGYRAGYLVSELYGVTTMVGFRVDELCSDIMLRAAGLHRDLHVVIAVTFPSSPPQYLAKCPGPGKVYVRQSSDTCLDNKQTLTDSVEFGLWWTLEQLLQDHLQKRWDTLKARCLEEMNRARERNAKVPWNQVINAISLATETGIEMDLRLATLLVQRSGGRFDSVQEVLFDEERLSAMRRQASQEKMYFDEANWKGFSLLHHMVDFLKERIRRCTERCIVCDKEHLLPLLKPVACDSELCNYQMADLGLGVNLESEVQRNPMVIDLLISAAYAAAFGKNKYTNFPFEGGAEMVMRVLSKCPSLQDMASVIQRGESLRQYLESTDPMMYKVVRWVIASNSSDIQPISRECRVRDMPEHQFLLNSCTPAAEARFQELKAKAGGSFFAFHGSALSSWHNILRGGLKKLDLRTAYGPGIYMATNASTSLGYMTPAKGFPNSKLGSQLRIMALCEVISEGTEKTCNNRVHRPKCEHNKQCPHIRVEAEECVVTRVLFLFTDNQTTYNTEAKNIQIPSVDRIGKPLAMQTKAGKH